MNIIVERRESPIFTAREYVLTTTDGTCMGVVYAHGDWTKRVASRALNYLTNNHDIDRRNVRFIHT